MIKPCDYCGTQLDRKLFRSAHQYCNASCQNKAEKLRGIDKTLKAHQAIREKGHYKRDNSYLTDKNPATSLEARKKISISKMGTKNAMYGKVPWNKLYPTKKWWEEREFIEVRKLCLIRDKHRCVACGRSGIDLYCDHIIPYRVSKNHDIDNLQMLCGSCHSKKTPDDVRMINNA